MPQTEMEQMLENVDRRLARVEQMLPTLASKRDLDRFATKDDLERFATKDDLERFATKQDLDRFATKVEVESLRGDVRITLDAVLGLIIKVDRNTDAITSLTVRLEHKGVI